MNDLEMFRRYFAESAEESPPVHVGCATFYPETSEKCPWPAVRLILTACVHEHIGPTYQCAQHAGRDDMRCESCWLAGHSCQLVAVPDPPANVDGWLIERIQPQRTEGLDLAEWREFVRENLYRLVPAHLREAS